MDHTHGLLAAPRRTPIDHAGLDLRGCVVVWSRSDVHPCASLVHQDGCLSDTDFGLWQPGHATTAVKRRGSKRAKTGKNATLAAYPVEW